MKLLSEFKDEVQFLVDEKLRYEQSCENARNSLSRVKEKLNKVKEQQDLVLRCIDAIKDVRPLLAQDSLNNCVKLCNTALSEIFDSDNTLSFSEEDGRFIITDSLGNEEDLITAQGGGVLATLSFIISVSLMIKQGCRKVMFYDEAFTQLSDEYLPRFIDFLGKMCDDLGVDLLLVTHDARLQLNQVKRAYFIEDGYAKRIK